MNAEDGLNHLNSILKGIADILYSAAERDAAGRRWRLGVLDTRGSAMGSSRLAKWRLQLEDDEVLAGLSVPRGVASQMTLAFDVRDQFFPKEWYGVLITVYPDQRCEVKFDPDPECVSKGFFDS